MNSNYHTPVLVEKVIRYLQVNPDGIYIDGTLGGGGHAESILMELSSIGRLIGFDMDIDAIAFSQNRLKNYGDRIVYMQKNISTIKNSLDNLGITEIDGLLLDLGVSSRQIDMMRGFSFMHEDKIDMRMNQRQELDGCYVINKYDEKKLADIFWRYGEERNSRKIANRIVEKRTLNPLSTTGELAIIIESLVGKHFLSKSLARIFQAIRIEVNNELENLSNTLKETMQLLKTGGRIVVISYHSLEDRIAKEFFKEESKTIIKSGNRYLPDQPKTARLNILTKKPIIPDENEVRINSRARSAKLRAAERI